MRIFRVPVLMAAVVLGGCTGAGSGDPRAGRAVAGLWCAECHRIAPDQPSGMRAGHVLPPPLAAPSFMDIASRPGIDEATLLHFTAELHLPMPTYRLSDVERRDVVAYILSLR